MAHVRLDDTELHAACKGGQTHQAKKDFHNIGLLMSKVICKKLVVLVHLDHWQ